MSVILQLHKIALKLYFFSQNYLKVSGILKKAANERTTEEIDILAKSPELTLRLQKLAKKRDAAKSRHLEVKSFTIIIGIQTVNDMLVMKQI